MTAQKLFSAEFREIPSVELTCKCGGSVTIPMPKTLIRESLACPGCLKPFWDNSDDQICKIVTSIVSGLSEWKKLDSKGVKLGFSIAMQE